MLTVFWQNTNACLDQHIWPWTVWTAPERSQLISASLFNRSELDSLCNDKTDVLPLRNSPLNVTHGTWGNLCIPDIPERYSRPHLSYVKLRRVELFMKLHLRATECHLPCGITQCYLSPDTSERTPRYSNSLLNTLKSTIYRVFTKCQLNT